MMKRKAAGGCESRRLHFTLSPLVLRNGEV